VRLSPHTVQHLWSISIACFWKKLTKDRNKISDFIDENRNSAYCKKFKLLPSESPHILVTTTYPDLDKEYKTNNYFIAKLYEMKSSDITLILEKLADQILLKNIKQENIDSESYWNSWRQSFESVKEKLNMVVRKIKVTFDTKFFKVEIDGGKS